MARRRSSNAALAMPLPSKRDSKTTGRGPCPPNCGLPRTAMRSSSMSCSRVASANSRMPPRGR
eukprot:11178588-Lingulodinium_polyedra.AAC.1